MGIFQQFPYSNFHEFNLDQIIKIMREMQDEWTATKAEWASYKEFIDNYFENLDVSEEVLAALRTMASTGELATVIDPEIATAVNAWLTEHITPTTPIVDDSLSIHGAAADAKATGKSIKDLKSKLTYATDKLGTYITQDFDSIVTDKNWQWTDKTELTQTGGTYGIYTIPEGISKLKVDGRNFSSNYVSVYAFVDASENVIDHYTGTNYTNITGIEVNVPIGAKAIYVNGQNGNGITAPPKIQAFIIDDIASEISNINDELNTKADAFGEYNAITPTSTVNGKLFNFTDKSETAQSGGLYSVYDVSNISSSVKISGRNFNSTYYPLFAFFDAKGKHLSHYTGTNYQNITDLEVNIPADATTLFVNGQNDSGIPAPPVVKVFQSIDLSTVMPKLIEGNMITINCFGDSTTDGAFVNGEHTADYGKAPYPARLKTLLADNGYDAQVVNSGVAGERTPDCTIRVGGFPCILTEDITIPADNTPQPLGTNLSISRGRVFGTTIQIPMTGRDGTDFCVYFTSTSVSKSPNIIMDGVELVVTRGAASPYPNYIAKKVNDNKAVTIPKGSMLFTSDNRNDKINIVMIGINDQYALRMSDWMTMMEKCFQVSNRCLIISSWIPMFNAWYDMTGTTTAEKYTEFLREANSKFGIYHVDMYALWYKHALEYALASGYLTDLTAEQKTAIQNKLDNHIIPAEFTYNNTEGEPHLNEIGYQVVAMIIFDRLKRVSFI